MKKILQAILRILARLIIDKYQPLVIGVTGSIGKTGAKEAISVVLKEKFDLRSAQKNYNNEFGLPLVIIGVDSGGSSVLAWLKVFLKAISLIIFKQKYPEVLVLEMGIDRPGDMDYLISIVKLDVAVLTYIGSSHLEYFKTKQRLAEEKIKIFKGLKRNGVAVYNIDNDLIFNAVKNIKNKSLAYGFSEKAKIRAGQVNFSESKNEQGDNFTGINFKVINGDVVAPVHLNGMVGNPAVYASLAAIAVGVALEMDEVSIIEGLKKLKGPNGRTKLIKGISNTIIIDDTYNAAPQSTLAALDILDNFQSENIVNKWAILGDMFELGDDTESGHVMVGERVGKIKKARLICIGQNAKHYKTGALKQGMNSEKIKFFDKHEEIVNYLKNNLKAGDVILVKGSQGMRMEKVVKGVMLEIDKSADLLVRQDSNWLK